MEEKTRKRIKNYYLKTQYQAKNFGMNTKNLFKNTIEVFNPISSTVKSLADTVTRNLDNKKKELEKVWEYNRMKLFSQKICREMYLYSEAFVEVYITNEKQIRYKKHDIENIVFEEKDGEFIKVEISLNQSQKRIYVKEKDKVVLIEEKEGRSQKKPFILKKIPLVRFSIDSNIEEALNIIDRINETEAFIRQIFAIQGFPVLHASNINRFADINSTNENQRRQAQYLKEANYNAQSIINTNDIDSERKAAFKFIELTNPLISEMQNEIKCLEERYYKIFPESLLVDSSNASINSSELTYSLKAQSFRDKISNFRTNLLFGILELDKISLLFLNIKEEITLNDYEYTDIFENQDRIMKLNEINKIAEVLNNLKNLDIDIDLQKITKELSAQVTEDLIEMIQWN